MSKEKAIFHFTSNVHQVIVEQLIPSSTEVNRRSNIMSHYMKLISNCTLRHLYYPFFKLILNCELVLTFISLISLFPTLLIILQLLVLFFLIFLFINCIIYFLESEGLVQSFYEIDFIGTDIRFQKALVFLMTRAQKTVTFTIGNFSPLSMATIVTVLNASISYFMLLRNLED
ncbi:hypothetical protein RI129_004636 [Pyrocoelia pectoralis]|uniref:Uncharacterized protein n=1 Tax=Pyrocoelia pectoralis TaxID=417401 RepID=A0AAN7ZJI3_9COLE